MAKEIGIAIGGGVAAAILLSAPAFGLVGVLLACMALLPLFAAGFGFGAVAGLTATATTTALVAMMSPLDGVIFAAFTGLPTVVLIRQALRRRGDEVGEQAWYPPGHMLAWLAAYGCCVFALAAFAAGSDGVNEIVNGIAEAFKAWAKALPDGDKPEVARALEGFAGYVPAFLIAGWMASFILNATVAQALLAKAGRAIRPTPRYAELELPGWYAAAIAGVAAVALIAPWMDLSVIAFAARNAALAMLAPFFLVGLAVIHVWSRRWPARPAILTGCYVVLVLFGWSALLVAGLGFMEQWLLLRQRGAGGTGQEEER